MKIDRNRIAFTLVELLVVIAIIGILAGMFLPAIQSARENARAFACHSRLQELGLAVRSYEQTFKKLPAGVVGPISPIRSVPVGYDHNWLSSCLPFLDQPNLYRAVDFSQSVYAPANSRARDTTLNVVRCPSNPVRGPKATFSDYAGCHDSRETPIDTTNNGLLYQNSSLRISDVPDGMSTTILLGEKFADALDLGWMSGTRATLRNTGSSVDVNPNSAMTLAVLSGFPAAWLTETTPDQEWQGYDSERVALNFGGLPTKPLEVGGFGSFHTQRLHFCNGDGRVWTCNKNIDETVLKEMANRNDSLPLSIPQ